MRGPCRRLPTSRALLRRRQGPPAPRAGLSDWSVGLSDHVCGHAPAGPDVPSADTPHSLQENKGASGSSVDRLPGLEPPEIGLSPHGRKLPAQAWAPTLWPVGVPAVRGEALVCLQPASHWVICKVMFSFPVLPTCPSDLVCLKVRSPRRRRGWAASFLVSAHTLPCELRS